MVKYGGVTEAEALAMITLNPAKQLGLEKRIGSIEVGKDADLAIFNGHPLNAYSRCEMTLIDGEVSSSEADGPSPRRPVPEEPRRGATLEQPLPRGRDVCAERGATIHPEPAAVRGTVVVEKGRSSRPGPATDAEKDRPRSSTATGLHLYPGMIDAGTVLGLTEFGSAQETRDFAEGGDFQPDLRASAASTRTRS